MAIRNIGDLGLDEITEEYLLAECEEMGAELNVDTSQGSIYRDASDGHIIRTAKFFNDLRQIVDIISINSCTGDVLDEKLTERGMERNPPADTAASYYVEFVGAEPAEGDVMSCDDHWFVVEKMNDRWVITSEETGTDMNTLVPGLPVIPELDVDNLISATLQELAVPAINMEDDNSARERLLNKISGPDENGNQSQIKSWCESVQGVGRARIIPLWNGPNTVKGIIISRTGGVPTQAVVDNVQEYVDPGADGMGEGKATIGQFFTAEAVHGVTINISVTVIKRLQGDLLEIKESLELAFKEYCEEIALEEYSIENKVRYNRISAIISGMEDVIDHENLLLNGTTENISFAVNQIPVLGKVEVNGDIL